MMLNNSINTAQPFSQVLFSVPCIQCETPVMGRTNHKKYCEECRSKRRSATQIASAESKRRKLGVRKVKGETFECERCLSPFIATSKSRAKFCEGCRSIASLDAARARSFGNDNGGVRVRYKGLTFSCIDCSSDFVADRLQTRCQECLFKKSVPHDGNTVCSCCLKTFQHQNRKKKICDTCLYDRKKESDRIRAHKTFLVKTGDPHFDLNTIMRSLMRHSLVSSETKKSGKSWQKLAGYSIKQLKDHLERQFEEGMTWQNRGLNGWHIDHIRPVSQFSYDGPEHPDFKACWSLSNLRPMWGDQNIRKKDKRIYLI